jgi:hypothetical protein
LNEQDANPDDREKLVGRRVAAHILLDEFFDSFTQFIVDEPDERGRREWAPVLVAEAMEIAAYICGPNVIADAYGVPNPEAADPSDRLDALQALRRRLMYPQRLFAEVDRAGGAGSFGNAQAELQAIASGDAPQLFAKLNPNKTVKHRVHSARLLLLQWDAYLEAKGVSGPDRHSEISRAAGFDWATIYKWGRKVRDTFGDDEVDRQLRTARLWATSGFGFCGYRDWKAGVIEAGLAYKAAAAAALVSTEG